MKAHCSILLIALALPSLSIAQERVAFDEYFFDKTLRIDYFHIGDGTEEIVAIDRIYRQGIWAGNPDRLIDPRNLGHYFVKVYDVASNRLIFSKGFSSYFGEYKTTEPAQKGVVRTYHETALIPHPKRPVLFVLEARDRKNLFHPFFSERIDPGDLNIIDELPHRDDLVLTVLRNGHAHQKVDLAFLGEGYTREEADKFEKDLDRFMGYLFDMEPYRSCKDRFNVYGVLRCSSESGTDEPRKGLFRNTVLNASFNALGLERYLLTEDNKSLRDVAANVPYDALCILVNSRRYGGGGIYNDYAIFTADSSPWPAHVFLHEFGHAFAGLADEYYASEVAYNEFYPKGVEPTEPNITALLDPSRIKWKDQLTPGIDLPTEWGKDEYDALGESYNALRKEKSETVNRMIREGAAEEEIAKAEKDYDRRIADVNDRISRFMKESGAREKVGAFEGAGYASEGLYRPMLNCLMLKFTKEGLRYCRVCERAVARTIEIYCE